MSRSALWSLLFTVLLAVGLIWVPEAEAWSVPVFTQPWTEIGINESEAVEKDQPAENELQEPEEPAQETSGEASAEIDDFLLDFESLYGTWHIWTPNSFVNLYDQEDGHYVTHDLVAGAEQGMVVVNPDGTYSMTYGAWGEEVVKGKWRLSYPREINGEVLQAIVLLDGMTGTDWAIAPSASGKIRLLWAMGWADGSATWIFDAELYRK